MHRAKPTLWLAVAALLASFAPALASGGDTPAETGPTWSALSDRQLDAVRGGFSALPGVVVSFGIVRTVHLNGALVGATAFQVDDLRSISAAQAEQLARQAAALSLHQSGAGNSFAAGSPTPLPGIVIQNTLSDQKIQAITEISAASNGMSLLKSMNVQQVLNDAIGAAARR